MYRKRPLLGTEFLGDVSISVGAIEEPPDFSMHRLAVHGDSQEPVQQTPRIIFRGVCFPS
ncbi:MAG: hypothetical protein DMG49_25155 [Acidobacteria bacterium]|nr:MAG: hypothetical protein DMG49_25155 [Acidobacteriota bacterium]